MWTNFGFWTECWRNLDGFWIGFGWNLDDELIWGIIWMEFGRQFYLWWNLGGILLKFGRHTDICSLAEGYSRRDLKELWMASRLSTLASDFGLNLNGNLMDIRRNLVSLALFEA